MDSSFVKVEHCDAQVGGGFRPPDGVVICHNHLASQTEVGWGEARRVTDPGSALATVHACMQHDDRPPLPGGALAHPRAHAHAARQVDHALTHELIHAYDHCRAGNLDWSNLEHHACSEIRAATLSGAAADVGCGTGEGRGRVSLPCP